MNALTNLPDVKIGVAGVSRDCFPVELTRKRLHALMAALTRRGVSARRCPVIIEKETDALDALKHFKENGVNAAVIYLGNFGPEGPTAIFARAFDGPVMLCAAAEENKAVLRSDRGDALCGLLNCAYNLGLRRRRAHIPEAPVGLPDELAAEIATFQDVARVALGVAGLKVIGFGPRPADFFACNAPIQPFYDLGVEVMENSELDLLGVYQEAGKRKAEIREVAESMRRELGRKGNVYPDLLAKLAQFEVGLLQFVQDNLGSRRFAALANKCWPAFERQFGFVPCYVNSRLAGRGIPVACEVDLYGALSEYLVQAASRRPATLLDINNSVPDDMARGVRNRKGAARADLFMGFHCGNTCAACMKTCAMNYQVIMNRLMEGGRTPDITRGTLEGQIRPGPTTLFRLQATPAGELRAYLAEGEFLDVDPGTFGGTGIVAIPGFARFYRHVLVGRRFPHHGAFGFAKVGRVLFYAMKLLGVQEVNTPLPAGQRYEEENPF